MAKVRMLIVDDIAEVRKDLRKLLTLMCDVEIVGEAGNGEEAIVQAQISQPDVILMDLEMPEVDGYHATEQVKKLFPACRVVALTVHGYEEARLKALKAGVDAFIVKGEALESLVQAIMDMGKSR